MPRQTWIADELRNWGLKVVEEPSWKTRDVKSRKTGRPYSFNPVGVMAHHTAARAHHKDAPSLGLVTRGRANLRGPLCQILLARSGTCHIVAAGHANHAGKGNGWRGVPAGSGNSKWFGIEAENDGVGEAWSNEQYTAFVVCTAALLHRIGQDESRLLGHKEWAPRRKIDPNGIDMDRMRQDVAQALANGPTASDGRGGNPFKPNGNARDWDEAEIRLAQGLMAALGPNFNPGPIDGDRGPKTRAAENKVRAAGIDLQGLMNLFKDVRDDPPPPTPAGPAVDLALIRNNVTSINTAAANILKAVNL